MGLIKAALNSAGSVLADQWREYFYCDSLDKTVLMTKGSKRTSGKSQNTKGSDNVISNGSIVAVADGQCMLIVEQGKVVEVCAEPGEFRWDSSTEPSIFAGNLGKSILDSFKTLGRRISFGGDTAKDQRVYYVNTKELIDNKFGTANPVPFRIVDTKIGLDLDATIKCSGVYSYKIADPIIFYTNVAGNVADTYYRSELDSQLKTEFISALQPSFGYLSELELRPNQIVTHNADLEKALKISLSTDWTELRGLEVVKVAIGTVTLPDEYQQMISEAQRRAMAKDPTMAAAMLNTARADAMTIAAGNPAGAMNGFIGMGMAGNAINGSDTMALYQMGAQQNPQGPQGGAPAPQAAPADAWTCPSCGAKVTGKFCSECGAPKPSDEGWTCPACGKVNKGKFCSECGTAKPAKAATYKCSKCGYEPEDPANPPKFCPNCGDPFGAEDKQ